MEQKCKSCFQLFLKTGRNQVYCSKNCYTRESNNRDRRKYCRKWKSENKDKVKANNIKHKKDKIKWIKENASKYKKKFSARVELNNAIARNEITPIKGKSCMFCNSLARDYHHPDYDFPLWVIPVCRKCHSLIHLGERTWRN